MVLSFLTEEWAIPRSIASSLSFFREKSRPPSSSRSSRSSSSFKNRSRIWEERFWVSVFRIKADISMVSAKIPSWRIRFTQSTTWALGMPRSSAR